MAQYKIVIDTNSQTKKEKRKDKLDAVTGKKPESSSKKKEKTEAMKAAAAGSILVSGAVSSVKTITNMTIDQIGARTDNVVMQNEIDNVLNMTGRSVGFLGTVAAGAKLGGAYGAIAAALVGTVSESIQATNRYMGYARQQAEHVQRETLASERLGITSADRNRGR